MLGSFLLEEGKMKINAVSYARFSSNNQRETSIEIQQEHISRYCQDNGINLIKEYVDRAISATSDNRPQFQQMIKDAETGLFSYVVIYNTSRFARNISDHLKYRAILESYGIRIVSVQESFDDSTPEGDLMSNFMMSINQYYSKDLGRKTYLGCLETAKACLHVGGQPPFGFKVNKEQKYEINEEEAVVVRLVFNMVASGSSNSDICDVLNKKGFKTRKGKPFDTDFSGMLRNRKYMGEYSWNNRSRSSLTRNLTVKERETVRIPNGIPAIVKEELFNKVQIIIDKRKHQKTKNVKNNHLLTGLLRCGKCGYRMNIDSDKNGNGKRNFQRFDYRCYSMNRKRADCDTKSIRVDNYDTYITNLLFNVLLNERYTKKIYKLIREKLGQEYERARKELIESQMAYNKTKDEIKNLVATLAEARSLAYQEIIKEIERMTLLKNTLEKNIEQQKKEIQEYPIFTESMIESRLIKMKSMVKRRTIEYIKPILRILVNEIDTTKDEILVKVNLNAYLTGKCSKELEIFIVEDTENIRNTNNQLKQKLNWGALTMRV